MLNSAFIRGATATGFAGKVALYAEIVDELNKAKSFGEKVIK